MSRRWAKVKFNDAKLHIVSTDELFPALLRDMEGRAHAMRESLFLDPGTIVMFELPGIVTMGRPLETFRFDGMVLVVPCEDVACLRIMLDESEPRVFEYEGQQITYHKIHGYQRCLVLSPSQREELSAMLAAAEPAATARGWEFESRNELLRAVMAGKAVG